MRIFWTSAAVTALTAGAVCAGGVDRSGQSSDVLFEKGRHLEFTLATVNPTVSGVEYNVPATCTTPGSPVCLDGQPSGDMAPSYNFSSAAYKADLSDRVSYAFIIDQPFGADVAYPASNYYVGQYGPSTATLSSLALTGLVKYTTDSHVSIFGGPRVQSLEAKIDIPFISGYAAEGKKDWRAGYVLGVAWEKPEIAARVSLTYNSAMHHELDTSETRVDFSTTPPSIIPETSKTKITTPQSINLSFQTGIAKDTLLFGNVRWAEWTVFNIDPKMFDQVTGGPIVSFDNNRTTYSLGLGRRLNDTWAIAGTVGYEATLGGISSNLAPTDGFKSVGFAATYTEGNYKVTAGVRYIWIGDATTQVLGIEPAGRWTGNTAVAAAIKVAINL